jgi:hypothetical protein
MRCILHERAIAPRQTQQRRAVAHLHDELDFNRGERPMAPQTRFSLRRHEMGRGGNSVCKKKIK